MTTALDLVGSTFGRLYIIGRTDNNKDGRSQWLCKCECGNDTIVLGKNLENGNTKSCGCLQRDKVIEKNKKGKGKLKRGRYADSPHYSRWKGIKIRTYNKNAKCYDRWGGRGIRMSKEFYHSFKSFDDYLNNVLGPCPAGYTLDRVDNDGHYEEGNLRWASPALQANNQRHNYFNGKSKFITEWEPHIQT